MSDETSRASEGIGLRHHGYFHDPVQTANTHIRFKARIAFEKADFQRFDQGAVNLIDELGPNSAFYPDAVNSDVPVIITQCDQEVDLSDDVFQGIIEFGVSADLLPKNVSLPLIFGIACYLATFSQIREYHLLDISFPDKVIGNGIFPGPRHGAEFIPSKTRARIGALIKPRFASDRQFLKEFVEYATYSKVDYICDDELSVFDKYISFDEKLQIITDSLDNISKRTNRNRD